ncbi:ATP-binding protein [Streptomyces sp. WI04-05B]|uniref:ATP-binding protein n=1 Tax=Streptomyces TaxID=1883 RepID=UPI0029B26F31|nr:MULTISPECIES: ATP-binding protein [unclassified Streptomyces]MDX2543768.1 ATP-binding protein [Streptomyces sp. WI04-05B]MDX2582142.1 ATP-binding protein [Streptomyces sp. WI04-05A]MDX3752556.1 ATP-binding protein [Streptomyces sp. AK08-02]
MSEEITEYDASHIQLLEGWKAIRKRPGMYIGSLGERGLLNMVFEVADRAVNELLAGRADSVEVTLTPDGGVRVTDDGPETPIDEAGGTGGPGLEALLTQIQAATGPSGRHDVALGPFGVGPFVVNALSRRMTAEVRREGVRWVQEYARGVAVTELSEAGTATGSGTTIAFWPDTDIFETGEFSFDALAARFRELAFLNRALDISLIDRRPGESRSARFRFPGGARDFVAFLDTGTAAPVLTETVAFELEDPRMAGTVEVALRWCGSHEERIRSFANSRPTVGGTHELGFRDGVVAAVDAYARERLLTETDPGLDTDRIGEGLTAVVSVKLDHPEFEGSTRGVLGNPQVRTCVGQAVQEHFGTWLEEHPEQASALVGRIQGTRRY